MAGPINSLKSRLMIQPAKQASRKQGSNPFSTQVTSHFSPLAQGDNNNLGKKPVILGGISHTVNGKSGIAGSRFHAVG